MRIAFITAGAAGMFCGSCMRDNALVTALRKQGHDALLIPTYTPIRTDDPDVSLGRVFYGGVSVYLDDKSRLFRHAPHWVRWLLDRPALLRRVGRFAFRSDYAEFAGLTASMLRGEHGRQTTELAELTGWLKQEVLPDVVLMTNALLSGAVPALKRDLGCPVLTTLQGDDIFLDALPVPDRKKCVELIRDNDRATDGYLCTSGYYADFMAGYLGIDRGKMHVVPPGIDLAGHGGERPPMTRRPTVGYFARICPEKGFHNLVAAFLRLRQTPGAPPARLAASGWLGPQHRKFFAGEVRKVERAGLRADFTHTESPTHADKVRFLQTLDVLSVPTDYREPKGLYLLEAWANGVPVVQPAHGSFPELIAASGGGVLYPPGDNVALAAALGRLLADPAAAGDMGRKAQAVVRDQYSAAVMAANTVVVLERYVRPAPRPVGVSV